MGEVIWVEILSGHRDVLSRHRCELGDAGEIFLGRGYDSDVLVDDPYVAPRHVRIVRDETGSLVAEDLGSTNGLYLDRETARRPRVPLDGDVPIRIGHTFVRVRDASVAVAPEREEPRAARTWHAVLVLGVVLVALTLLSTWLEDTGESKTSTYVFPLFGMGLLLLGWTSGWAVFARIFGGVAHFERHLFIAMVAFVASFFLDTTLEVLAYSFSLTTLSVIATYEFWVWLAVLGFFHLREIGRRHLVLKGAIVGVLAVLAIGGQMLTQAESGGWLGSEVAVTALKPPSIRLASPRTEAEFFADVEALRAELERARTEEPVSGGILGDLDLDE